MFLLFKLLAMMQLKMAGRIKPMPHENKLENEAIRVMPMYADLALLKLFEIFTSNAFTGFV